MLNLDDMDPMRHRAPKSAEKRSVSIKDILSGYDESAERKPNIPTAAVTTTTTTTVVVSTTPDTAKPTLTQPQQQQSQPLYHSPTDPFYEAPITPYVPRPTPPPPPSNPVHHGDSPLNDPDLIPPSHEIITPPGSCINLHLPPYLETTARRSSLSESPPDYIESAPNVNNIESKPTIAQLAESYEKAMAAASDEKENNNYKTFSRPVTPTSENVSDEEPVFQESGHQNTVHSLNATAPTRKVCTQDLKSGDPFIDTNRIACVRIQKMWRGSFVRSIRHRVKRCSKKTKLSFRNTWDVVTINTSLFSGSHKATPPATFTPTVLFCVLLSALLQSAAWLSIPFFIRVAVEILSSPISSVNDTSLVGWWGIVSLAWAGGMSLDLTSFLSHQNIAYAKQVIDAHETVLDKNEISCLRSIVEDQASFYHSLLLRMSVCVILGVSSLVCVFISAWTLGLILLAYIPLVYFTHFTPKISIASLVAPQCILLSATLAALSHASSTNISIDQYVMACVFVAMYSYCVQTILDDVLREFPRLSSRRREFLVLSAIGKENQLHSNDRTVLQVRHVLWLLVFGGILIYFAFVFLMANDFQCAGIRFTCIGGDVGSTSLRYSTTNLIYDGSGCPMDFDAMWSNCVSSLYGENLENTTGGSSSSTAISAAVNGDGNMSLHFTSWWGRNWTVVKPNATAAKLTTFV